MTVQNLTRLRETNSATQQSMRDRITKWQEILKLKHWDILVKWDACLTDDEAEIDMSDDYLLATLRLSEKWPYWTEEWADSTIVHELLHVLFRDQDVSVQSAEELLDEDVYKAYWNRYNHEREGSVDLLASIIVNLANRRTE